MLLEWIVQLVCQPDTIGATHKWYEHASNTLHTLIAEITTGKFALLFVCWLRVR